GGAGVEAAGGNAGDDPLGGDGVDGGLVGGAGVVGERITGVGRELHADVLEGAGQQRGGLGPVDVGLGVEPGAADALDDAERGQGVDGVLVHEPVVVLEVVVALGEVAAGGLEEAGDERRHLGSRHSAGGPVGVVVDAGGDLPVEGAGDGGAVDVVLAHVVEHVSGVGLGIRAGEVDAAGGDRGTGR